jgi:hypothetical protein
MIVEFSEKVEKIDFVPVLPCEYLSIEYDATGSNPTTIQDRLKELAERAESKDKLVLLNVFGQMSGGKISDIDFQKARNILRSNGAMEVMINYQQLTSTDYSAIKVGEEEIGEIEARLFKENLGTLKLTETRLKGESGVALSRTLLAILKQEKKINESKNNYENRIISDAIDGLNIKRLLE